MKAIAEVVVNEERAREKTDSELRQTIDELRERLEAPASRRRCGRWCPASLALA